MLLTSQYHPTSLDLRTGYQRLTGVTLTALDGVDGNARITATLGGSSDFGGIYSVGTNGWVKIRTPSLVAGGQARSGAPIPAEVTGRSRRHLAGPS